MPWCRDSIVNEKHLLNERHTKQEARKFVLNDQWLKPLLTLNRLNRQIYSKDAHLASRKAQESLSRNETKVLRNTSNEQFITSSCYLCIFNFHSRESEQSGILILILIVIIFC